VHGLSTASASIRAVAPAYLDVQASRPQFLVDAINTRNKAPVIGNARLDQAHGGALPGLFTSAGSALVPPGVA